MTADAVYVLEKMAHGFNRMGRAAGRGFYDYDDDHDAPTLWSGLKVFERRRISIPAEDIRDRLLLAQVLGAIDCLEAGVIGNASEADLASRLGAGFPQGSGGAMTFVERSGRAALAARARELAQRYGERFKPDPILAVDNSATNP